MIDNYFCRHDGDDFDSYSSVTAPYPPPPPEPRSKDDGYIQPSQEALQRLAGTASKRSKLEEESFNQIIDVNFDDIKPDAREWLTKALTEDDADKPGPKVIDYFQSYEVKSPPWTILWFRILGIFSVENIARLGVFMFQTSDNSQLCIDSQYSSQ